MTIDMRNKAEEQKFTVPSNEGVPGVYTAEDVVSMTSTIKNFVLDTLGAKERKEEDSEENEQSTISILNKRIVPQTLFRDFGSFTNEKTRIQPNMKIKLLYISSKYDSFLFFVPENNQAVVNPVKKTIQYLDSLYQKVEQGSDKDNTGEKKASQISALELLLKDIKTVPFFRAKEVKEIYEKSTNEDESQRLAYIAKQILDIAGNFKNKSLSTRISNSLARGGNSIQDTFQSGGLSRKVDSLSGFFSSEQLKKYMFTKEQLAKGKDKRVVRIGGELVKIVEKASIKVEECFAQAMRDLELYDQNKFLNRYTNGVELLTHAETAIRGATDALVKRELYLERSRLFPERKNDRKDKYEETLESCRKSLHEFTQGLKETNRESDTHLITRLNSILSKSLASISKESNEIVAEINKVVSNSRKKIESNPSSEIGVAKAMKNIAESKADKPKEAKRGSLRPTAMKGNVQERSKSRLAQSQGTGAAEALRKSNDAHKNAKVQTFHTV